MITEFVKFKALDATTDEQLISETENLITDFWKNQDGFIDSELMKSEDDNKEWCSIYHFESMEKLKNGAEKMRTSKEFGEFMNLLEPGSIRISFYHFFKNWKS